MNTCYVVRSSRPAGLFSFGLLNGLPVRLRRPHLREAPAGFGLERLAAAFMIIQATRKTSKRAVILLQAMWEVQANREVDQEKLAGEDGKVLHG
jgi:hypothetical protein